MRMRTIIVLFGVALPLAGCGGGGAHGGALAVVASTNVYGDIASQIGGRHVRVTSLLSGPTADPHLFEPDMRTGLAVARARVVIENGAGYDAFMSKLLDASPSSGRVVVDVATTLGVHGHDANPHLWYDVPRVPRIARAIEAAFVRADGAHARAYHAGLTRFTRALASAVRSVPIPRGRAVAYTEPVPAYLVAALGLRNLAPEAFTRAIENGTEPSPDAVAAMERLLQARQVDALLYNSQAASPITKRLRSLAESSHVPVVGMSETLPPHLSYQRWLLGELRALQRALA